MANKSRENSEVNIPFGDDNGEYRCSGDEENKLNNLKHNMNEGGQIIHENVMKIDKKSLNE